MSYPSVSCGFSRRLVWLQSKECTDLGPMFLFTTQSLLLCTIPYSFLMKKIWILRTHLNELFGRDLVAWHLAVAGTGNIHNATNGACPRWARPSTWGNSCLGSTFGRKRTLVTCDGWRRSCIPPPTATGLVMGQGVGLGLTPLPLSLSYLTSAMSRRRQWRKRKKHDRIILLKKLKYWLRK